MGGHHILWDEVTAQLISSRVAEVYTALYGDGEVPDSPFGGFSVLIAADSGYRASAQFTRDRRFWGKVLADCPEMTSLSGGT